MGVTLVLLMVWILRSKNKSKKQEIINKTNEYNNNKIKSWNRVVNIKPYFCKKLDELELLADIASEYCTIIDMDTIKGSEIFSSKYLDFVSDAENLNDTDMEGLKKAENMKDLDIIIDDASYQIKNKIIELGKYSELAAVCRSKYDDFSKKVVVSFLDISSIDDSSFFSPDLSKLHAKYAVGTIQTFDNTVGQSVKNIQKRESWSPKACNYQLPYFFDPFVHSRPDFPIVGSLMNDFSSSKFSSIPLTYDDGNKLNIFELVRDVDSFTNKERVALSIADFIINISIKDNDLVNKLNRMKYSIITDGGTKELHRNKKIWNSKHSASEIVYDFFEDEINTYAKKVLSSSTDACESIFNITKDMIDYGNEKLSETLSQLYDDNPISTNKSNSLSNDYKVDNFTPLILARSNDHEFYTYNRAGSLITVAPPRSGKSRTQVIPNLLNCPDSIIVFDPKNECFDATAKHRESHFGRVIKFSPFDTNGTHCFNPLNQIEKNDFLWDNCFFIADIIIPASKGEDRKFWRDLATKLLSAVFCYQKLNEDKVINNLNETADLLNERSIEEMSEKVSGIKQAERAISQVLDLPDETLQGILVTAQQAMMVFESEAVSRSLSKSDWCPQEFRKNKGTTLYICLPPSHIEKYSSLVRVIISQHLRAFVKEIPTQTDSHVLFLLDELPRLGYMQPVEESIQIGAQYNIRTWMFSQDLDQLKNKYQGVDGLIGSCAVRCYMNPSLHDGLAEKISSGFGDKRDMHTGNFIKKYSPNDIAGEKFSNSVFVFETGKEPLILNKNFE